jgi:hypothetical protein
VEYHEIQVLTLDFAFRQAKPNRPHWKRRIIFDSAKTLFLGRGNQKAILK